MLALMLYAEARRPARRTDDGAFVPLEEQDVARWDRDALAAAERLLSEASAAGPSGRYRDRGGDPVGPCHAAAGRRGDVAGDRRLTITFSR